MITRPSLVQLDLDDVNDDTLAINYVVCQPLDFLQLFTLQPTEANEETYYMDVYSDLTPVPTNGINFSIDFLPHFEYILYRVAQLVNPKDPTGILPRNHPPHVIMFQGSHLRPTPTLMVHQLRLLNLQQEQESSHHFQP
ncbi:hypothetical protein MHU86_18883 [Fragilaria crotonensis]|nr:hypothetical protein MHU86_18883 [Fragilaria crotonensis]